MSEERVSVKFTQGTWTTWSCHHEMADTGDFYDEIGVMVNGKQIAVMCGDLDDDEIVANAHLMKMSPVFYDLLKRFLDECAPDEHRNTRYPSDELLEETRKALAEARGEA